MSVTTASTTTQQIRRPNSTHLESLLVTDFYGIDARDCGKSVETPCSDSASNFISRSPPSSPTNTAENYYFSNDSPRLITHKRERSLPISNNVAAPPTKHQVSSVDDSLIYANLAEIERKKQADFIDRQQHPPIPGPDDQPIRYDLSENDSNEYEVKQTIPGVLRNSGWKEFRTSGGRTFFFNSITKECQWIPPRNASKSNSASSPFIKAPNMIESARKPYPCDTLQNNSYPSSPSSDNTKQEHKAYPASSSLSTDSTSTESLKYAEPPLVVSTHVTNPLLEKELYLARSKAIDPLDKSMSFRGNTGNQMTYRKLITDEPRIFSGSSGSQSTATTIFPVSTNDMSISMSAASSLRSRTFFTPSSAIHQGTLDKCKLLDGWAKVKKNQWSTVYAFLYSGHLLFYRDQKSAEKHGKHYPTPLDVCDLRGAKLCYVDSEKFKDKRHKYVLSLQMPNTNIYLFSTENEAEIKEWFSALKDAILSLPQFPEIAEHGSLGRASSNKITSFNSKQPIRQSIKNGSKTPAKSKVDSEIPPKQSIVDRLLRFLRSRPTVEALSERGIYRSEPVFGSTLTAVCEHDGTSVPRFITEVTSIIEKRGLKIDGLYRVSGNLSSIQKLRCLIDQDRYDALSKEEDVHVLTGALKLFLRELHDPVIPLELNKEFMSAIKESPRNRFKVYDDLLKRLPEVNRNTLSVLIGHLRRVAQYSSENRMQIHNLAIVFGPALFHPEGRTTKTHQRRNSGFLSKKQAPSTEQKTMPSQNLAYHMIVFGQITESILNDAKSFEIFADMPM